MVDSPVDAVQRAIDPKNDRLKKFLDSPSGKLPFSKFWLLVAADSWNMELSGSAKQHIFASDFHQTFFLERIPERLTTLKTSSSRKA